ncbi:hypothetical protein N7540_013149 [Penicillium herquei]|nr:hypothetical protein N7540_013149 [Penicillium herquei]
MDLKGCIMKLVGILLSMSLEYLMTERSYFIFWRKEKSRRVLILSDKESKMNPRDHEVFIKISKKADYGY